jgi:hypothetical protein
MQPRPKDIARGKIRPYGAATSRTSFQNEENSGAATMRRWPTGICRDGFGIRDVEEVRDLIVNRQEPLRLSS